jgi:secondary thiamine-phosphate synthase enzyme
MSHIINVSTQKRIQMLDITTQVAEKVKKEGLKEGMCMLYCPHTTAGITINENADPSVRQDILNHLEKLVPFKGNYSHLEGNADAHIKASIIGSSATIIVTDGRLMLGTWQGIFFCEFDGPRQRKLFLQLIPVH